MLLTPEPPYMVENCLLCRPELAAEVRFFWINEALILGCLPDIVACIVWKAYLCCWESWLKWVVLRGRCASLR